MARTIIKESMRIGGRKVDAVVGNAVGQRQQAGEYRRARRLAHQVGRDAGIEARAETRHFVQVRGLDVPTLEAEAIAALLVRRDEYDVQRPRHLIPPGCRRP